MKKAMTSFGKFVRIFCAIVFFAVGFAHKVPFVQATAIDLSEFALPDGTIPDICLTSKKNDGTPSDHHGILPICEACLIASAALLPLPALEVGPRPVPQEGVNRPKTSRFEPSRIFVSQAGPRAPPYLT